MSGVLVLAGPTASGKTDLAIELAQQFDAEIVSADSRQIYAGMPIGTAAPSDAQRACVPHHLVGFLSPFERYSAARFAHDASLCIAEIHARGRRAIVVGGTGFYIRALTGAVTLATEHDDELRSRLAREARMHDAAFLHAWLTAIDPRRAAAVAQGDTYRVTRALEVALAKSPVKNEASRTLARDGVAFVKLFLDVPFDENDARIERRVDRMLEAGFVDEAERIGADAVAANAVGYAVALAYRRGWSTHDEMRARIIMATRRYARRQRSWFRSEPDTQWLSPSDIAAVAREKLGWI